MSNRIIRIMSSNTLGNCGSMTITNRDDALSEIYLEYRPDVLALQEVSTKLRREENNLFSLIAPDYTEIDTPVFNRSHNNSTPLVYNIRRLELIDRGYLFYMDGYCDNSKSASWGVFRRRESGERFCVISTHFIHIADDGRVKDAEQLKLLADGLAVKYSAPVYVCGDFNANMNSDSYKTLTGNGFLDLHETAREASDVRSFHQYPQWDDEKQLYVPGALSVGNFRDSIDHVFSYGTAETDVLSYRVIYDDRARTGSDHCPVCVDLIIGKETRE